MMLNLLNIVIFHSRFKLLEGTPPHHENNHDRSHLWHQETPFHRDRKSRASPKPCNTTHKSFLAQEVSCPGSGNLVRKDMDTGI